MPFNRAPRYPFAATASDRLLDRHPGVADSPSTTATTTGEFTCDGAAGLTLNDGWLRSASSATIFSLGSASSPQPRLSLSLSFVLQLDRYYSGRDKRGQGGERGNPKYPGVGACRASESAGSYIQAQLRVICSPGRVIPVERSPTRPIATEERNRFAISRRVLDTRSSRFVRERKSTERNATIGMESFLSDRVGRQ